MKSNECGDNILMYDQEDTKKYLDNIKYKNIAKALGIFQSKCPTIEKNKKGYGYKYADHATIISTIQKYLIESELSYTQLIGGDGNVVFVKTILFHVSGEHIESSVSANVSENKGKGMTNIQAMGAVTTYLKRYSLSSILGIVTEEDTDGTFEKQKNNNKMFNKNTLSDIEIESSKFTNPETEALKKLRSAKDLDDLRKIFINLGNQKSNPVVIDEKDRIKLKFEDI